MAAPRLKALLIMPNFSLAGDIGKRLNDRSHTFDITHVQWVSAAEKHFGSEHFDVVLLSLSVLDHKFSALTVIQQALPAAPILVIASIGEQSEAVRAIQHGADDCIVVENLATQSLRQNVFNTIDRKRLLKDIQAGSYEDSITGLYDGFESVAQRLFEACRRPRYKVYVISFQVQGAAASDLSNIADALRATCRKAETSPLPCVSRVSPEEFILLAPAGSLAAVHRLLNRSEENLRALAVKRREATPWSVASGMAAYDPEYPSSPTSVLECARKDLEVNNRHVLTRPHTPEPVPQAASL
jgi:GGDEF domain-containing protein